MKLGKLDFHTMLMHTSWIIWFKGAYKLKELSPSLLHSLYFLKYSCNMWNLAHEGSAFTYQLSFERVPHFPIKRIHGHALKKMNSLQSYVEGMILETTILSLFIYSIPSLFLSCLHFFKVACFSHSLELESEHSRRKWKSQHYL